MKHMDTRVDCMGGLMIPLHPWDAVGEEIRKNPILDTWGD